MELYDILDTIEKQKFVAPGRLSAHFWDMKSSYQMSKSVHSLFDFFRFAYC